MPGGPTRSEVRGHHGYRLSSLVSPLPNAAWGKLAAEFLAAKKDPDLLRVFVNTILGEAWRDDEDKGPDEQKRAWVHRQSFSSAQRQCSSLRASPDPGGSHAHPVWFRGTCVMVLTPGLAWGVAPGVWVCGVAG